MTADFFFLYACPVHRAAVWLCLNEKRFRLDSHLDLEVGCLPPSLQNVQHSAALSTAGHCLEGALGLVFLAATKSVWKYALNVAVAALSESELEWLLSPTPLRRAPRSLKRNIDTHLPTYCLVPLLRKFQRSANVLPTNQTLA